MGDRVLGVAMLVLWSAVAVCGGLLVATVFFAAHGLAVVAASIAPLRLGFRLVERHPNPVDHIGIAAVSMVVVGLLGAAALAAVISAIAGGEAVSSLSEVVFVASVVTWLAAAIVGLIVLLRR